MNRLYFLVGALLVITGCGSPLLEGGGTDSENAATGRAVEATAGCPQQFPLGFEASKLCARLEWFDDLGEPIKGPIHYRNDIFRAISAKVFFMEVDSFKATDATSVEGVRFFSIKLWMPTHGHGSDIPVVKKVPGRLGEYQISDLAFIMDAMDGPWQVKLQLKSKDLDDDYSWAEDPNVIEQVVLEFRGSEVEIQE